MHKWIREKLVYMQDRSFPSSLIELKKMANESNRFRNEEIPSKQREKQRLHNAFRELTVGVYTGGRSPAEGVAGINTGLLIIAEIL